MSRPSLVTLAAVYTVLVAIAVSVADVSGGVVFAVAVAWFSIGRAWARLPQREEKQRFAKWGRQ